MLKHAESLISDYHLLPQNGIVLCAVSGGADSMCLLHFLSQRPGLTLHAAHFDHRLRGAESEEDAQFVRDWCRAHQIPFHLGAADVSAAARQAGQGIEETARQLRYAFLQQTAEEIGAAVIATAHNADDNAETILLHLIRGTGLRGLCGIPPRRENLIRPLLTTSRTEILAYLEQFHIPHREDSSNADLTYARNHLRAKVMPVLKQINSQVAAHMGRTAAELSRWREWMDQQLPEYLSAAQVSSRQAALPLPVLQQVPPPLRPTLIQALLDTLGVGRKDFGAVHLEAVLSLREGGHLDLPHGVSACCREGLLSLTLTPPAPVSTVLSPHQPLLWGNWMLTLLEHPQGDGFSLQAGGQVTVRTCLARERLALPGAPGPRTVKRLCRERGISPEQRDRLPAVEIDGRLAAVWPLGVDIAFVPQGGEGWFLQVKLMEKGEHS